MAANPTAKATMDPNFEKRLREMKEHAKTEMEKRQTGEQVKWFRPKDWDGDLAAIQAMEDAFDRTQANDDFVNSVKDGENPGVTGDVVATTTMIETLSSMERAFRMRHTMSRPRAVAHMLSRKKGHGSDTGVFIQNGVEYLRSVLKQSRAEL